jgi:hypothetical protein
MRKQKKLARVFSLSLTSYAWSIIKKDQAYFAGVDVVKRISSKDDLPKATVINLIFQDFFEDSQANIYKRKTEIATPKLSDSDIKKNKDELKNFGWTEKETESLETTDLYLLEKALHTGFKTTCFCSYHISLKRRTIEMLSSAMDQGFFNQWDILLKSVIEEFCMLPLYRRELVYLKDKKSLVNNAIIQEHKLKFINDKNEPVLFSPVYLLTDMDTNNNYVVGLIKITINPSDSKEKAPLEKKTVMPFRLCKLYHLRDEGSVHISKKDRARVDKEIAEKGLPFLSSYLVDVAVRFSDSGIQKFQNISAYRPNGSFDSQDTHLFTCHCTWNQAYFYFIKFGSDAEILSPEKLRKRFADDFKAGNQLYNSDKQELEPPQKAL